MLLDGESSKVYRWLAGQLTILHFVSQRLTECVSDSRLSIQVVKKQISQQLACSISRLFSDSLSIRSCSTFQHKFCNSHVLQQQCDGQQRQYSMATDNSSTYGAYACMLL